MDTTEKLTCDFCNKTAEVVEADYDLFAAPTANELLAAIEAPERLHLIIDSESKWGIFQYCWDERGIEIYKMGCPDCLQLVKYEII